MAEFDLETIKRQLLWKYPAFGTTIANVKYQVVEQGHGVKTAETDGKTIFINADWFAPLTPEEQLFVLAHEAFHIALNHITREKDKDHQVWNIATDAVINQYLQKDQLPLVKDGVNIPKAIQYSAEAMYDLLLKDQDLRNQWQNGGHDDHAIWQEAVQENALNQQNAQSRPNGQAQQNNQNQTNNPDQPKEPNQPSDNPDAQNQPVDEQAVFAAIEKERNERANQVMQKLKTLRQSFDRKASFKDLGDHAKPVVNWKKILRLTLEIEDEKWGHRFSDQTNNYAARIEDVAYDERGTTEIILDTSGSVSQTLLRNFLRQVKTILRDSDLKVGTFSDDFHGFQPIKKVADIDNLALPIGGGTNFDAASRAFTKRRDVNKICFTDGDDDGATEIETKRKDIIWISFQNPNFKPDFGKVIYIPESQLEQLLQSPAPELTR